MRVHYSQPWRGGEVLAVGVGWFTLRCLRHEAVSTGKKGRGESYCPVSFGVCSSRNALRRFFNFQCISHAKVLGNWRPAPPSHSSSHRLSRGKPRCPFRGVPFTVPGRSSPKEDTGKSGTGPGDTIPASIEKITSNAFRTIRRGVTQLNPSKASRAFRCAPFR